jgi:hypothetical protein
MNGVLFTGFSPFVLEPWLCARRRREPDLFASQFEETAAKGSRLGAPEPIALLLE